MFKVANVVRVASREYAFKFDTSQNLGMIAPIWDPTVVGLNRGWTTFKLELSPVAGQVSPGRALGSQIGEIKPSLMLFLRTLRVIQLGFPDVHDVRFAREDLRGNLVRLKRKQERTETVTDIYLLVKHNQSMAGVVEPKREHIADTEVVLAFPLTSERENSPLIGPRDVHAFLPLRDFGFKASSLCSSRRPTVC